MFQLSACSLNGSRIYPDWYWTNLSNVFNIITTMLNVFIDVILYWQSEALAGLNNEQRVKCWGIADRLLNWCYDFINMMWIFKYNYFILISYVNWHSQSGPTVVSAQSVAKWYIDCTFVHCVLVKWVNLIPPSERCQYECSGHEFCAKSCPSRNNPTTPLGSVNSIIIKGQPGRRHVPNDAHVQPLALCAAANDIHTGVCSFSLWL